MNETASAIAWLLAEVTLSAASLAAAMENVAEIAAPAAPVTCVEHKIIAARYKHCESLVNNADNVVAG